jgi:putative CocE/NonD family hydrolase
MPAEGVTPPVDLSHVSWLNYHLKGIDNGIDKLPAVTYFVMGSFDEAEGAGNIWRHADVWPVPSQKTPFYLASGNRLLENNLDKGDKISYSHNPLNPVPTIGGRNLFMESGPKDQRSIEGRPDVILFTTEPLKENIEITGDVKAKLFIGTDQKDSDIVVRLTDVYPDGKSILITEGILRLGTDLSSDSAALNLEKAVQRDKCAQDSDSQAKPADCHITKLVRGNQPVLACGSEDCEDLSRSTAFSRLKEVNVNLAPTSLVFAKGHRIRISVSGSNFPRYERNLNVGLLGANSGVYNEVNNTIYLGSEHPSQIILPIVRRG